MARGSAGSLLPAAALGYDLVGYYGLSTAKSASENDAVLATATADAEANGHALVLPKGSYRVSSPVDLTFDYATLIGESAEAELFHVGSGPILKVGGKHNRVENLALGYETVQTAADTDSTALECTNLWMSEVRNLLMYHCARGIYQPADEGSNYFFSNLFSTIKVYRPSISAIHLKPTSTGNTGSLFQNVHIDGDLGGGVASEVSEPPVYLESCSGMVFDRLNVEWLRATNASGLGLGAIKVRDTEVTFRRLYMEGMESEVDGGAWLEAVGPVGGSRVLVDSWSVNDGHADDAGVFTFGVLKVNDAGTTVVVRDFSDSNVSTSGTYYVFLKGAVASGQAVFLTDTEVLPTVDDRVDMSGSAPQVPVLREYGSERYAWREGTGQVVTGTAAPVSGTWAVGDRVVNTAPSAGGASEWRCTAGGTPGTWKALLLEP